MGSFVELLGIEGGTKTKGEARAEEDVVGNSSNTTVVDLGLSGDLANYTTKLKIDTGHTLANEVGSILYLLATSRPTLSPALESHVALAPASTWELTLW